MAGGRNSSSAHVVNPRVNVRSHAIKIHVLAVGNEPHHHAPAPRQPRAGREESRALLAAMEEWRNLARTVPATWLFVSNQTSVAGRIPRTIDQATHKLGAGIFLMQMRQWGFELNENHWLLGRPPAWYSAAAILDDARRDLLYLRTLHTSAGHVFLLHRMIRGIHQDDPVLLGWEAHRADAVRHAALALQRLRSAASHARARRHAFLVADAFPRLSPDWTDWLKAAVELARFAVRDAIVALHDARRMSRAVTLEFFDAWMVLNR